MDRKTPGQGNRRVNLTIKGTQEESLDKPLEAMERSVIIRAMLRFIYAPISLLIALILLSLIVIHFGISALSIAMPTIITLCGFGIAFFGAFWDFGARKYLNSLANSRIIFSEKDVTRINKQQLQLTLIYLGIAGLYVLSGFLIFKYS